MSTRHFLSLMDCAPQELQAIVQRGIELKTLQAEGRCPQALAGRSVALLFEKPSTRTRVSFEVGVQQLGGQVLFLAAAELQLGRGEPPQDTARTLSRMVDAVVMRTARHETLEQFAAHASVPVINALTGRNHPCQLLADMQTFAEHRGAIAGRRVAWIGDGNNVCYSYINAARQFDFQLYIACPEGYEPPEPALRAGGDAVRVVRDPVEAARDADLLVTDVWASMGQEQEREQRRAAFGAYQLNRELLQHARPDALYMHCLPAHREEEISTELLDAEDTVIWDEAENRLHAQKALLEFLLCG